MANLKDFQDAYQAAEAAYQNAISIRNSAYNDMQAKHALFSNCKYKWAIPALGTAASVQGCDSGVNASQHPGCGSKNSCEGRVSDYNGSILSYDNAVSSVASAQQKAQAAKDALANYVQNDPAAQDEIKDQEAKRNNIRYIVIAGIVVAVIVISIIVYRKYIKKS